MEQIHKPVWVEINTGNLRYNIKQIRSILTPGTKFLGVIKANAYGHGILTIAEICEKEKIDMLGVFSADEGIYLRENGISSPILLFNILRADDCFNEIINYNLTPAVGNLESLKALSKYASSKNTCKSFHLKVDTGCGRIGAVPRGVRDIITELKSLKSVSMTGLFTHLSDVPHDTPYTRYQIKQFSQVLGEFKEAGYGNLLAHAANSAATLKLPETHFSMVRPGSSFYGMLPFDKADKYVDVRPVLAWKSKIVFIKKVPKGTSISYGRTFISKKPSLIATLPVGYADGYDRKLSNRGFVIINDKKAKIAGRVCMNMTMVDVTDIKNARIGDEAILLGSSKSERISAEDMAKILDTINLEIVTKINKEVPRRYTDSVTNLNT